MQRWLCGVGIVVTMVGLAFVFPQVAQLRDLGSLKSFEAALLVLGSLMTFCGLSALARSLWTWRTSR